MEFKKIINKITFPLLASLLVGCTTIPKYTQKANTKIEKQFLETEEINPEIKNVGNLYFYDATDYINDFDLETLYKKVHKNFTNVGIVFKKSKILKTKEFPKLNNLDVLLFVCDPCGGIQQYGLDNNKNVPFTYLNNEKKDYPKNITVYDHVKNKISFPYDSVTSSAHTAVVSPKGLVKSIEYKDFFYDESINLEDKFTKKEKLRVLEQVFTHEVAHGLGTVHMNSHDNSSNYFMGNRNEKLEQVFHLGNVNLMKKFVDEINVKNPSTKRYKEINRKYFYSMF